MPEQSRLILETAKGESFLDKADRLFTSAGLDKSKLANFNTVISSHLSLKGITSNYLQQLSTIDKAKLFDRVFSTVCTNIALYQKRQELTAWTTKAKKGKALFVKATMGLGKTFSIVNALGGGSEESAIIFMPTRRLCYEMVQNLKRDYRSFFNLDEGPDSMDDMEIVDSENNEFADFHYKDHPEGYPAYKVKPEAYNNQIYWLDGINEADCIHYNELIKRYQKRWYKREDLCSACVKQPDCRFYNHINNAPYARIIVTTHQQYERVYRDKRLHKWIQVSGGREPGQQLEHTLDRQYFIVDEDLVLSQCYQPISLNPHELRAFIASILDVVEKVAPKHSEAIREKITLFWGRISLCDKTAYVAPVDRKFKFPKAVIKEWDESFHYQFDITPDTFNWEDMIGNHISDFENAMRKGVVVQRYQYQRDGEDRDWYQVHLPNPKTYDLSKLPAHVFFDGTKLKDKYLKHKLKGVKFDEFEPKVKPIWKLNVWQNLNDDLPMSKLPQEPQQNSIKNFISYVFDHSGQNRKYLFIASKGLRKRFLDDYLDEHHKDKNKVVVHYGQSKGLNIAEDCDVVVMLGSFLISDAVEIAMALDFVQDVMPHENTVKTEGNIWGWKREDGRRVYKDDYEAIKELAEQYRFSEQRQAMARARYLFHDTDFYVVSKDPVTDYESFLPEIRWDSHVGAIFQAPTPRENKRNKVEKAIRAYLAKHGTATISAIHHETKKTEDPIARDTIRRWKKELIEEGVLKMVSAYKFRIKL